MQKLILSKEEKKKLDVIRKRRLERLKKNFLKKKQNHLNSEKYKKFNGLIKCEPSDILFAMRFRSSFSLYLYLYLKTIASFYQDVGISEPIEVNFEELKRLTGLVKNTIKKAFWELVDCGLIVFNEDITVNMRHNLCKSVMVFDDRYLIGFNEIDNQTYYSIKAKL
jgi:hypothetical protein